MRLRNSRFGNGRFPARKQGENEIDLIAENEFDSTATFYEVKTNPDKYSEALLLNKIAAFRKATKQFSDYSVSHALLSPAQM